MANASGQEFASVMIVEPVVAPGVVDVDDVGDVEEEVLDEVGPPLVVSTTVIGISVESTIGSTSAPQPERAKITKHRGSHRLSGGGTKRPRSTGPS